MGLTYLNEREALRYGTDEGATSVDLFRVWDTLSAAVLGSDWDAVLEIAPVLADLVKSHGWAKHVPYAIGTMYYERCDPDVRSALDRYNAAVKVARGRATRPKTA